MWKSAGKIALATAVFAVFHSAVASRAAKQAASRLLGERRRNAFYRPFYIAQSLAAFAALGLYARSLPDRTLYHVRGRAALPMRAGQLAALAYAVHAARQVGLRRMLGVNGLTSYLSGGQQVLPEPESQGPAIAEDGEMRVTGAFRFSRHPLNFAPLPIFLLNPKMTVQLAAFLGVSSVYFVLGSMHEEHRLRMAYGESYDRYIRSGVPFYLPRATPGPQHAVRVDPARHGADSTEAA